MISKFPKNNVFSASGAALRLLLLLLALSLYLANSLGRPSLPPLPGSSGLASVLAQPEVIDWRTENSRHYDLGNGRYAAVIQPLAPSGGQVATFGAVQEVVQGSVALVEGQPEDDRPAFAQACVGHFVATDGTRSLRRAYVQFPLAALPANVTSGNIIEAAFYAAPDGTLAPGSNAPEPFYEENGFTLMPVTVHPVQDDSWITAVQGGGALAAWPAMGPAVSPQVDGNAFLSKDDANAWLATGWDVTGAVQNWYNTPADNFGLALRLAETEAYADYTIPESGLPATFMCFPTPSAYNYATHSDGSPIGAYYTTAPGMALLVEYTIHTLATDDYMNTAVPSTAPTDAYINQAHHYSLLPSSSSQWQLLATFGNPATGFPLANVPMELYEYHFGHGLSRVRADDGRNTPNYIAINPTATGSGETIVQVLPETSPTAGNHDNKAYQLQFLEALPVPPAMPLPPGSAINIPLSLPMGNLLMGQQLTFAADTTVEIRVEGLFSENDVRVFAPTTSYESRNGAGGLPLTYDGLSHEIEFSVNDETAGDWLFAFTHTAFADPISPDVQVTVCANSDDVIRYPLEGECLELRRPDPGDFNPDTLKIVGNVRVYSPGGFSGDCDVECTTINTAPSGEPVMPLIGHVNNPHEWMALKGGTATVYNFANQRVEISNGTRLVLADFADPSEIVSLPVLRGQFLVDTTGAVTAVSTPASTYLLVNSPMHIADDKAGVGDKNGWEYSLNLQNGRMLANGPAVREVQPNPDGGTHTFTFAAEWHITAHGGASLQGNATLNQVAPLPIRVGVLELSPPDDTGYTLEFDALAANPSLPHQIPPFRQIRFAGATLAQPASLGGARVAVQGVLLPPDTEPAAAEKIHCGESCLSLRGPNDSLSVPDYKFRMPDLIIQNEAS
ncbi:MAG: hypothetical protein R6X32_16645, partial [Chloroflexota bacterium]